MNPIGIFLEHLLNGMHVGTLAAGFFFAFLGVILNLLIGVSRRDPSSSRTPYEFDWKFLKSDNAARFFRSCLTAAIVIFLSLRFAKELVGTEVTMIYALFVGLSIDTAIDRLQKLKIKK